MKGIEGQVLQSHSCGPLGGRATSNPSPCPFPQGAMEEKREQGHAPLQSGECVVITVSAVR